MDWNGKAKITRLLARGEYRNRPPFGGTDKRHGGIRLKSALDKSVFTCQYKNLNHKNHLLQSADVESRRNYTYAAIYNLDHSS